MVRVTYGRKFGGETWSYEICRYMYTDDMDPDYYLQICDKVESYIRKGATKVTIKVERL